MFSSKWPRNLTFFSQNSTQMKKFVFISDAAEALERIMSGKRVGGVLFMDGDTGCLTFKAYNRKPQQRPQQKLLRYLEHGWVKESAQRIRVFESLPKRIGAARMISTLERETREAVDVIVEQEFFGKV